MTYLKILTFGILHICFSVGMYIHVQKHQYHHGPGCHHPCYDPCKKEDGKNETSDQTPRPGPAGPGGHPSRPLSPYGSYKYAAVTTDADPCAAIGVDIMIKQGGTAVDAAIATVFCVGVVNCHSTGIGGGDVMIIYETPNNATEKIMKTIFGREKAPSLATQDMFVTKDNVTVSSTIGGKAIGIPGEVKGLYHAWKQFGHVEWKKLLEPSIKLCKTGFVVNPSLNFAISGNEDYITNDPNLRELLMKSDGTLAKEGEILTNPKYGRTLQVIADDPTAFYDPTKDLAKDIIADIADYGGIISESDLESYYVYDMDPLSLHLSNGNYTIHSLRPPASGAVIEYILNILNGYTFTPDDISTQEKRVRTYHRIIEAFKFAYAKRSMLGDAEFLDLEELLSNLTSADFAAGIRALIKESSTQPYLYYKPAFKIEEDSGTAHISVYSPSGSAVALTSTINHYFGSKCRGSRTGIIFNNEMDDFSTPGTVNGFGVPASPANYIEPGKMPMSSMCPSIIVDKDGQVRIVSGASGGTRITTATAYVILHALWLGLPINEATDIARVHHQLVPEEVWAEYGFDLSIQKALEAKNHQFVARSGAYVQSIHNLCTDRDNYIDPYDRLCVHAVSDKRKAGHPDGV